MTKKKSPKKLILFIRSYNQSINQSIKKESKKNFRPERKINYENKLPCANNGTQ